MKIKDLGKTSGTHAANAKTHRVDHSIKSESFSVQKKYWLTDHHSGSSLLFDVDCRVCCCALKHIQIHSTGNNLSGSPWINMWKQGLPRIRKCALSPQRLQHIICESSEKGLDWEGWPILDCQAIDPFQLNIKSSKFSWTWDIQARWTTPDSVSSMEASLCNWMR